jgi:hypothetical protein
MSQSTTICLANELLQLLCDVLVTLFIDSSFTSCDSFLSTRNHLLASNHPHEHLLNFAGLCTISLKQYSTAQDQRISRNYSNVTSPLSEAPN